MTRLILQCALILSVYTFKVWTFKTQPLISLTPKFGRFWSMPSFGISSFHLCVPLFSKSSSNSIGNSESKALITSPLTNKNIILFDGVCNFCNKWVDLIISMDAKKKFQYFALQSLEGQEYLRKIGKNTTDISTVVLIKLDKNAVVIKDYYFKSDVPLQVCDELGFPYSILANIGRIIPTGIRDAIYDVVAKNRYSLMGKRSKCRCEV